MSHEVKKVDINLLTPREGNPNVLDGKTYNFLMKEIKDLGMVQPILVDKDYVIIDGEHRWRASRQVGLTEVDVVVVDIDQFQAMATLINMNMIKGEFDSTKLGTMIEKLIDEKGREELEKMIAIEKDQINEYIRQSEGEEKEKKKASNAFENYAAEGDPNEFKKYPVEYGELWECGSSRVLCGDSTDHKDVDKLFKGVDQDLCKLSIIHPDDLDEDSIRDVLTSAIDVTNAAIIILEKNQIRDWLIIIGELGYHYELGICAPEVPMTGKGEILCNDSCFIPFIYVLKDISVEGKLYTPPIMTDMLTYPITDAFIDRGVYDKALPKDLVTEYLRMFCNRGESVYDPFVGSGTTLVSAQLIRRTVYCIDKSPTNCSMALSRWSRITGKDPVRL